MQCLLHTPSLPLPLPLFQPLSLAETYSFSLTVSCFCPWSSVLRFEISQFSVQLLISTAVCQAALPM